MELLDQFKSDTFDTINSLFFKVGSGVINLLYAIIIMIIGWLITKFILYILKKALDISKIDSLTQKINDTEIFGKSGLNFNVSSVILSFVKWILLLVFIIIALDIMQWNIISIEISNLLRYLPKLFSAIVLFMVGIYIANFIRKAIFGMFNSLELNGPKIMSNLVFYGLVAIITITALNQAGVDTAIITNNLTLIIGSFLLTFSIAFGLGSKDIIQRLLLSFYTRKNYAIGDKIKFKTTEGTIEAIDNICLTLKTTNGKIIIPINELIENQVEIFE